MDTLKNLMSKAGGYQPLYGDRLANHLPMVLYALKKMGASDNKLEMIYQKSILKLNEIEVKNKNLPVIENIGQYLGNSAFFPSYLQHFRTQIRISSREYVIKEVLPVLLPGVAASAFHALIRLAFAIEAENDNEVAHALAYWCAEFQPFDLSDRTTDETPEEILERIAPLGSKYQFLPGIIVDRMSEIESVLQKKEVIFQPKTIRFSDIRLLCLKAFSARNNFTLLHTVTGCQAFRIVAPFVENNEIALRELWKAIVAAYLSTGLEYQSTDVVLTDNGFDFNDVISLALESTDDHEIKLVYSCFSDFQIYKDALYYFVANRAVS